MNEPIRAATDLDREHLPALFRAADDASDTAQRKYLRLVKADLVALVVGALLSAVSLDDRDLARVTNGLAAVLLAVSLFVTVVISQKGYRQKWYGARAMAESVKTRAWQYMAAAGPYPTTLEASEADRRLAADLNEILAQNRNLSATVPRSAGTLEQITKAMRRIRGLPLEERKAAYVGSRIHKQAEWYADRARENDMAGERLFYAAIAVQTLAVSWAIGQIVRPGLLNLTGALAAAGAGFLAWIQVKQHQELTQAYGVAAQELALVSEESRHVHTDDAFARFVEEAESAISREHTLWIARRS